MPSTTYAQDPRDTMPKVSATYIWLMVLAQFGVFLAFITPIAISLSIRVTQLAPGHEEYLGYITGIGALVPVVTGPLLGTLSDRTRTRIGRRRPFMIAGTIVGVVSLVVMAQAPSIPVLGLGWILAQLGWGQALGGLVNSMADRLPESQRGKVAGLVGFATLVAPVVGVVLAGFLTGDTLLLFLVPGAAGVVLVALFACLVPEPDSRGMVFAEPLTASSLARKYVFDPRRYPDYAWNWLGRFLFYFGLTLNTTFTAFFFAARLGVTVPEVATTIATVSALGVLATSAGALGGGFLSDRLRRRRVFVLSAGVVYALGSAVMVLAPGVPLLFAGSVVCSVGLGMFSSVDQALLLDVLPERETDAGRFMGIIGFATSVPQSVAPLVAPLILAVGAAGEKNYTLLYLTAAVCTVLAGLIVLRIKSVR
ncbi:MFS family permease [Thermocatellispora tengchongensis]|uniref:MFS family permease n=1 Tax=Thermocatellispora tengchongensis TaxID=1073253 RepID=A0A840P9E8_9ACTN|nr:MFS transporter [Thermocatellispora tengchongensis]MBB5135629.1 MFS family permease [Thermocatellispora tengchongensis]